VGWSGRLMARAAAADRAGFADSLKATVRSGSGRPGDRPAPNVARREESRHFTRQEGDSTPALAQPVH
jgi:hypothetical protein